MPGLPKLAREGISAESVPAACSVDQVAQGHLMRREQLGARCTSSFQARMLRWFSSHWRDNLPSRSPETIVWYQRKRDGSARLGKGRQMWISRRYEIGRASCRERV